MNKEPLTDENATPLHWLMLEILEDLLFGEPDQFVPVETADTNTLKKIYNEKFNDAPGNGNNDVRIMQNGRTRRNLLHKKGPVRKG